MLGHGASSAAIPELGAKRDAKMSLKDRVRSFFTNPKKEEEQSIPMVDLSAAGGANDAANTNHVTDNDGVGNGENDGETEANTNGENDGETEANTNAQPQPNTSKKLFSMYAIGIAVSMAGMICAQYFKEELHCVNISFLALACILKPFAQFWDIFFKCYNEHRLHPIVLMVFRIVGIISSLTVIGLLTVSGISVKRAIEKPVFMMGSAVVASSSLLSGLTLFLTDLRYDELNHIHWVWSRSIFSKGKFILYSLQLLATTGILVADIVCVSNEPSQVFRHSVLIQSGGRLSIAISLFGLLFSEGFNELRLREEAPPNCGGIIAVLLAGVFGSFAFRSMFVNNLNQYLRGGMISAYMGLPMEALCRGSQRFRWFNVMIVLCAVASGVVIVLPIWFANQKTCDLVAFVLPLVSFLIYFVEILCSFVSWFLACVYLIIIITR